MADVFISYKKEDRALAERVEAALRREGISSWWDASLTPRESWDAIIQREIANAAAVIVIWTPRSVQSEWVRIEANYGKQHGKLVPLLAEPCDIPLAFSLTQAAHVSDWNGTDDHGGWRQALGWINALKNSEDGPDPLPGPEPQPAVSTPTPTGAPLVDDAAAARMWASIENSLDPRDYVDFRDHFPTSKLTFEARRRIRQLEDWAAVDENDHAAINAFRADARAKSPLFPALEARTVVMRDFARSKDREAERAAQASGASEEGSNRTALWAALGLGIIAATGLGVAWAAGVFASPPEAEGAPIANTDAGSLPALRAGDTFRDCDDCPEMVVLPAGSFVMGSPAGEDGRGDDEGPLRTVQIGYELAVGKYEVTWAEWEACVADGDPVCTRGARNGAVFSSCEGSGTEPVGFSAENAFGLHDMHGNVWEWTQDCYVDSYSGAPTDGSARIVSDCSLRVLRGGSWNDFPRNLRSADRNRVNPSGRLSGSGFRVAKTLSPPTP